MRSMERRYRIRRLLLALLLVLSPALAGCTPEEIEMSIQGIATSFEQGGVERGLITSVMVLDMAIPVVEMRFRSAFGP